MKKLIGRGAVAAIALLAVIQLVPYGRDHRNPPVANEPAWDTPRTRVLFVTACRNCHSNETEWPWYASFAPTSWLVYHDVQEGRSQFNVSRRGRGKQEADAFALDDTLRGRAWSRAAPAPSLCRETLTAAPTGPAHK